MTFKCERNNSSKSCCLDGNVNVFGICDTSKVKFTKSQSLYYRTDYNWTEMSLPEVLKVPCKKPNIEHIDQVFINVEIVCVKLIETPKYLATTDNVGTLEYDLDSNGFPIPLPNEEGTYLTGRKLIVEGLLKQKIVYTADVISQSVHSAHFEIPFSTFIMVYPKFESDNIEVDTAVVDLNQIFNVDVCVEDVFVKALDPRTIFKNVTLFLKAKPASTCQ